jgi:hypothetical protein
MRREYFIVAIEGEAYQFGNFKEALEKYYTLKALGYYEAVLRKHFNDGSRPLTYSDRAKCFFA